MNIKDLCCIGLYMCSVYIMYYIIKLFVFPKLLDVLTKVKEINPSWLAEKLRSQYYGYHDIDFIICDCPIWNTPRFRITKDSKRLEFLIPSDVTAWDREKIAKIALMGKIKIKYDVDTSYDKPIEWLSILCYMLDGNDINLTQTEWTKK